MKFEGENVEFTR